MGDRVNTAARVQAAADPGTVLVDDITRQITSTAVAYEDAGHHELKGKAEPVHLWRALEVLVGPGESGPEAFHARFVGRDADLRLIKELFRAGVSRRSARLVAVSGPAGVGQEPPAGRVPRLPDAAARSLPVAPGPLPALRRRRCLLGAGRDGPPPARDLRGCPGVGGRRQARGRARALGRRSRRAGVHLAAPRRPARCRRAWARAARSCSPGGACSSSGCPSTTRW